ncbi:MAG: metallopeptidase family protein, partial [Promicromonosporaceae bacterium]|nr:metallopeptidase family protein [Promicromonosporaceae bacterium]
RPHTATQAREWFEEVLREEITTTVIHEVAHHFGISDERLYELGWD